MIIDNKINYYLDVAECVSMRSTCIRKRYGAVIVKNDEIISTGYTGAPRNCKSCFDLSKCIRKELNVPRGQRYELCRSIHAEANAIISESRANLIGSELFLVGIEQDTANYVEKADSCSMCKKLIINAGIKTVYIRQTKCMYDIVSVNKWIDEDELLNGIYGY